MIHPHGLLVHPVPWATKAQTKTLLEKVKKYCMENFSRDNWVDHAKLSQ